MKKLCILSLICAFAAGTASAGEVKLFGAVDLGLKFSKSKGQSANVTMDSGTYAGSRWGLTGKEEINSDLAVSFLLESGFDADTGASKGKLFNRGSLLRLESKTYGTLAFGRTSSFTSASGEYGWMWQVEPFEGGYLDAGVQATQLNMWGWRDDVIMYISPKFADWEIGFQYSLKGDDGFNDAPDGASWHQNDHYWNAAARYKTDKVNFVIGAEGTDFGTSSPYHGKGKPFTAKFGTGITLPKGTVYFGYCYSQHQRYVWNSPMVDYGTDLSPSDEGKGFKTNSFYLGYKYPLFGGYLLAQYQFLKGKDEGRPGRQNFNRNVGAVGYHYFLSNRTMLYAVASYAKGTGLLSGNKNSNRVAGHLGMAHFF